MSFMKTLSQNANLHRHQKHKFSNGKKKSDQAVNHFHWSFCICVTVPSLMHKKHASPFPTHKLVFMKENKCKKVMHTHTQTQTDVTSELNMFCLGCLDDPFSE